MTGFSGAGKDYFCSQLGLAKVSLVRPLKKLLEDSFGLPAGHLDTPEGKLQTIPGTNQTYLDFLIESWRESEQGSVFGNLWVNIARQKILALNSPCITDFRSFRELDMVKGLVSSRQANLVHFHILGGTARLSDIHCVSLAAELKNLALCSETFSNTKQPENTLVVLARMQQILESVGSP